jgi:putative phage-type endonuclease
MKLADESYVPGAQQSAQWLQDRIGKLTASNMAAAMSFLKSGQESAERRNLKIAILAERMTDIIREVYVSEAMIHGTETEPVAKLAYTARTGVHIMPAPFIEHPTIEYFGASPDGLIGVDGLLEVKAPTTTKFISWVLAGVVPEEHKPQMLAQLACTGRKWVEFVAFDPRMPEGKRLFIRRYEPTKEEIEVVEDAALKFLAEVEEMFEQVTCAA